MAETYYSLTELVKLTDNLIASLPTSFYNGIMAVRGGLVTAPAADVVARDCYDRVLVENDELRKERPVVRCEYCAGRRWCNFRQWLGEHGYCSRGWVKGNGDE